VDTLHAKKNDLNDP
jgi:hypothetical protein